MSDSSLVLEWLRYSHNDLISARHLFDDLHPKQTEIACYLSQQCAEKALKGYLLFKDNEPPRTHNLVELCQMCINLDVSFSEILDLFGNPIGSLSSLAFFRAKALQKCVFKRNLFGN